MGNYDNEAKKQPSPGPTAEVPQQATKSNNTKDMTAQQKRDLIKNAKIAKRNDKDLEIKDIKKKLNSVKFLHQ